MKVNNPNIAAKKEQRKRELMRKWSEILPKFLNSDSQKLQTIIQNKYEGK